MSEQEADSPLRLYVACGTYDGSVFAMQYEHTEDESCQTLKAVFIDPEAHPSPITALALGDDIVVSGSSDEAIQVFSLSKRCRLNRLEMHTGSIKQLEFATGYRHLLSAGEDAYLAIWRRSTTTGTRSSLWECIRKMQRHKGPITALALHPSSRVAFTLSDDSTMRVWNLMRGRQAYAVRIKALLGGNAPTPIDLAVSPNSGRFLLLQSNNRLDILDLTGATGKEKPMVSERFPKAFSFPPVFFQETDEHVYLLSGFGNQLQAFRFLIAPGASKTSSNLEPLGEVKLPGKRLKFLKVLPWISTKEKDVAKDSKLVVFVTTDMDGSYVRGYTVSLASGSLADASAIRVVFTYDIRDIRLTHVDANWGSKTDAESNTVEKEDAAIDDMNSAEDNSEDEESEFSEEESMDEG